MKAEELQKQQGQKRWSQVDGEEQGNCWMTWGLLESAQLIEKQINERQRERRRGLTCRLAVACVEEEMGAAERVRPGRR